jgi:hypothetical protein
LKSREVCKQARSAVPSLHGMHAHISLIQPIHNHNLRAQKCNAPIALCMPDCALLPLADIHTQLTSHRPRTSPQCCCCTSFRSNHIQQHAAVAARSRLESLRNLSLLYVYAQFIVTARTYKVKRRNRKVPKKLTLNFADVDSSACNFTVPKGLNKAEQSGGLPSLTLMLVACYDQITLPALRQLLADVDCLDQQHAAPMVLKLLTTRSTPTAAAAATTDSTLAEAAALKVPAAAAAATAHSQPASFQEGGSSDAVHDRSQTPGGAASQHHPTAAAAAHPSSSLSSTEAAASSVEELIAAVAPLLQQRLVHVVMEGGAASPALYFIPTKRGFHRRVPAGAAAADAGAGGL